MKKNILITALILISSLAFSQDHYGNFKVDPKMKKAPYSFVWIEKGKTAVEQTEITVDEYLAFIEAVTKDSMFSYVRKLVPSKECSLYPALDTNMIGLDPQPIINESGFERKINWIDEEKFQQQNNYPPKVKNKDVHEDYINPYNLPITGISYEQAIEYAKWCTLKFNESKKGEEKKQIILFRLPSPAEFTETEKKGMEGCLEKDPKKCEKLIAELRACQNEKGCALCNCEGKDTCAANKKIMKVFGPEALYGVYSFNANFIGLYNMMGNASEMTSEKGIAKGGSYLQLAKDCQPESVQHYDKPEKWLGLRLFAEVKDVDGKNIYYSTSGQLIIKK